MSDTPTPPPEPAAAAAAEPPARREPWHQLSTETETAYGHFRGYLNQERGRRSIRRLAEDRGVSPATLSELSGRHQWVARVQAHDAYFDAIEDAEFEAERKRIARDAARAAGSALQAAQLTIRAGILGLQPYALPAHHKDDRGVERLENGDAVLRLTPDQALAALRAGTRSAVAAHQLVADRVAPGDEGDTVGIEEVAFGMSVLDLARHLVDLSGDTASPAEQPIAVDDDVIDVDSAST